MNKSKCLKWIVKNFFYQITKNEKQTIKNKTNKKSERTWNNSLGYKDFTHNFRTQEVKMSNKVPR